MDSWTLSDSTSAGRVSFLVTLAFESLRPSPEASVVAAIVGLGRSLAQRLSPEVTHLRPTALGFRLVTTDTPDGLIDGAFAALATASQEGLGPVRVALAAGMSEPVEGGQVVGPLAAELKMGLDGAGPGDLVATGTIKELVRRHRALGERFRLIGTRVVDGQAVELFAVLPAPARPAAPAPPEEAAALVGLIGDRAGGMWRLDGSVTIGRASEAVIRLDDPSVSRAHATITRRGSAWVLVDAGSANGTYVNGDAVRPNEEIVLAPDDIIGFGSVVACFVSGAEERLAALREDRVRRATLEDPRTGLVLWPRLSVLTAVERARALHGRRPLLAFVLTSHLASGRSQAWSDTLALGRAWRVVLAPILASLNAWEFVGAPPSLHLVVGVLPERTHAGELRQSLEAMIAESALRVSGRLGALRVYVEDLTLQPTEAKVDDVLRRLVRSATPSARGPR